jgi:integrase/recombinase XerD
MKRLRDSLEDYLTTRRALGFKLKSDGTGLATFVAYLEECDADHITTALALTWAQLPSDVQPARYARRLGFVRGFARYVSAIDARTEIPPTELLPAQRVRPEPYIFDDGDIERLLQAALQLPPKEGLKPWTFHCLFGLLSVSGLRTCEARGLTLDDVDLQEGIITVRTSKFGKSRLVPLHASTVTVLADYLERRARFLASRTIPHVFINDHGLPLSHDQALDTFKRLTTNLGLPTQRNGRRPHLHDLRHRFALQTLLHWYRDGEPIERRLPILSAYLGHTEIGDTYWYLSARPELLNLARTRLEQHWGETP